MGDSKLMQANRKIHTCDGSWSQVKFVFVLKNRKGTVGYFSLCAKNLFIYFRLRQLNGIIIQALL